eukprot:2859924-Ditylum_brightwellii.AAC.1
MEPGVPPGRCAKRLYAGGQLKILIYEARSQPRTTWLTHCRAECLPYWKENGLGDKHVWAMEEGILTVGCHDDSVVFIEEAPSAFFVVCKEQSVAGDMVGSKISDPTA